MKTYKVIGVMSGTSLDGVDIAYCEFRINGVWEYKIIKAETIEYPGNWKKHLNDLLIASQKELEIAHFDYGNFLGKLIKSFIDKYKLAPDFISSHGHTILHQPEKGITLQIGDGKEVSRHTELPVVFDFRTLDVKLGGQGAPLVPIGDKLLFHPYPYCLNLGGIANISFESNNKRVAFDICPANLVLNHYAKKPGIDFDENGVLAASGEINSDLLERLNKIDFYQMEPPKSLGREWVEEKIFGLLESYKLKKEDILRTFVEHIAVQVSKIINPLPKGKLLVTGGGAKNSFLISILKIKLNTEVIIPDEQLIDYKEALIFAFLGVLRWRNDINCLSSVTGAVRDSSCGLIFM